METFIRAFRSLAYKTPVHRWFGLGRSKFDRAYWDRQLAGEFRPHLGGTLSVDVRNAISLALIKRLAPDAGSILDMGCASGSLARAPGAERFDYVGVDISDFAVEQGRLLSPGHSFCASHIEGYEPKRCFDVVVFNEVLYYLDVASAAREAERFAGFLNPGGLIIVGMKHDPKALRIFSELARTLKWRDGILWQEKIGGPCYSIARSPERPGYLIGALQ